MKVWERLEKAKEAREHTLTRLAEEGEPAAVEWFAEKVREEAT